MVESASHIQNRLERVATEIFQRLTGQQIDHLQGYDPLVFMMLGASASEFEKLNHEIADSREKILEKLASILCPDVLAGPIPAYAVLHAASQAGIAQIHRLTEFKLFTETSGEQYFTPAGDFEVSEISLRYLILGKSIQKIHPNLEREFITPNTRATALGDSFFLWLGLEKQDHHDIPAHLSLYVDATDERLKGLLSSITANTVFLYNGQPLKGAQGVVDESAQTEDQHQPTRVERETREKLKRHFVRIHTNEVPFTSGPPPQEIISQFGQATCDLLEEPCIWIRADIIMPQAGRVMTDMDVLDQLTVATNCIPVINRSLNKRQFKLSEAINLFPLPTEGHFHEVEEVISSHASHHYEEKPYYHFMEEGRKLENVKAYALRRDGISRFDERDASELLTRVSQKIREEGRVFSSVGKSGVTKSVQNLQKELHQLKTRLRNLNNHDGSLNDVFIGFPPAQRERVIVRYWSTAGAKANRIPKNTQASVVDMAELVPEGVQLVKMSEGGREPLSDTEKLHAFRSLVLGRTQMTTEEQIRRMCEAEAGPFVREIRIEEDIKPGKQLHSGLQRVLSITLIPAPLSSSQAFRWSSWDGFARDLEETLEASQCSLLPVRVSVEQEDDQHI